MTARLPLLQNLLAETPGDTFTLFALAKEFEKTGDDAAALEFYLKLKAADPAYVGLFYHLGKLYERAQDTENAFKIYREGMIVARQAKDFHALNELAGAKLNLGDDPDDDDDF